MRRDFLVFGHVIYVKKLFQLSNQPSVSWSKDLEEDKN